jgi:hypothetical protein
VALFCAFRDSPADRNVDYRHLAHDEVS